MYQLLIVDDETSVVDSLALTVPWKDYGIEEVHCAYSAKEALHIAAKHSIDIMITDIQMPEMSGLELIEIMQHYSRKIRCIILSGHDEFEYAKKAMAYQTLDYLLKPIDYTELINSVKKAIQLVEEEWKEVISFQRIKQTLETNLPLLRSQLLNDLLKNKSIHRKVLEERLALVSVPFRSDDLYMMMVVRMEEDFSGYDLHSLSLLEYAVTNIAEEVFENLFSLWHCVTEQGYLVFLIKGNQDDALRLVDSFAVKLQNHVQKFLKGSLSVCLSNIAKFPEDLQNLYLASINAINRKIGSNKSYFLTINETSEEPQNSIIKKLNAPPALSALLDSGSWDEAIVKIDELLVISGNSSEPSLELSQDQLFTILLYLSSSFTICLQPNGNSLYDQMGPEFDELLHKKGHLSRQRIHEWANKIILTLKSNASTQMENTHQQISAKVRTFIHENLSKGISLQIIADHVGLHPVYLSKIYKTTMKETIGDYIYKFRMDRAVHLLRNTNLKVAEISDQLGFQATPHFIKIFKEHFGTTPQDYRNR
ncbi:two component transcriptional regulator, AraC family [Paenibacillus sp. CF095]|uniref:response regulator transcription factor n=1 Tax=Paenibacillus sp. CF095 TaxID=1881033 RepID=UPI00088F4F4F|nr:response regulator [Paenibacillus sp. CF095]SDD53848.1 two component transcriptional regulator, AraC family [Paenibacillus sp. CF095]